MKNGTKIGVLFLGILMMIVYGQPVLASAPDIPVATNVVQAGNWAEFAGYVANPAVDQIDLTADITVGGSISVPRTLTINGGEQRYKINMQSYTMTLASTAGPKLLSINNVDFSGSTTTNIFNNVDALGANWTLNFQGSNLSTAGNVKRLATLTNGTIYFSKGTTIQNSQTNPMIVANKVYIEDNFSYTAISGTTLVNSPFMSNTVADGSLTIDKGIVNLRSGGNLVTSASTLTDKTFTFNSIDSTLNITNASRLYSGNGATSVDLDNTTVNVGTIVNEMFQTNAANASINANVESSTFSGTTTGSILKTQGATSPVEAILNDSSISIGTFGGVAQATNIVTNVKATFSNTPIEVTTLSGPIISGGRVSGELTNSDINIKTNLTASAFSVLGSGAPVSSLKFLNSDMEAHQSTTTKISLFSFAGSTNAELNDVAFDIDIAGRAFDYGAGSSGGELRIINGSKFNMKNSMSTMITSSATSTLAGVGFLLEIDGENTRVNLTSASTLTSNGNSDGSIIGIFSPNPRVKVKNKAEVYINSTKAKSPAQIKLQSRSAELEVSGESKVVMTKADGTDSLSGNLVLGGANASATEGTKVNVSGGSILKMHSAGASSGVAIYGGPSDFKVSEASQLEVYNEGGLTAGYGINSAYSMTSSLEAGDVVHNFEVVDENSSMTVVANNGPVFMGGNIRNTFKLTTGDDTYSVIRGRPYETNAIVTAFRTQITLGRMKYFDWWNRNNLRYDFGRLFLSYENVTNFNMLDNHFSTWLKPSVNVNPTASFANASLNAEGINLQNIKPGTTPIVATFLASNPILNLSRMNGNNQRAQINEIRIPTNADKHIWLHASVPEGIAEGNRDAFTDEVTVKVAVKNADGSLDFEAEAKSVGDATSVYGEDRKGMIKIAIPNDKFISTGQKVEVIKAWRGAKLESDPGAIVSLPTDLTGEVTVIDVTPPTKSEEVITLTNATKQITGKSLENGAKVFVKVNNEWLKDDGNALVSTLVANGEWTINLPSYVTKEDVVDIYLKDTTEIKGGTEFDLPTTYTNEPDGVYGNLNVNPTGYAGFLGYHDAVNNTGTGGADDRFDPAVREIAADVLPDAPTLVKSVTSSGGFVTGVGDTLTYTLVAGNSKAGVKDWRNVEISDILAQDKVAFNPSEHGIKIDGVTASAGDFTFDVGTGKLTIKGGNIAANETVTVTFNVTVLQGAFNNEIKNRATATGYSPQETPFVAGPVNPNANHVEISVESNEVGVPGNNVIGSLTLVSAPETIDFGTIIYTATTKRVEDPTFDQGLVVSDTREENITGWNVTASLSTPMTNDDGRELVNALRYVNNGQERILNSSSQVVYLNGGGAGGSFDISSNWGTDPGSDGLKLQINSNDKVYTGAYEGEITWQLMAGQP